MSIAIYAEATPLPNVVGRIDYISNPKRQEHLLATASTVDDRAFWRQLAADSQTAWQEAGGARVGLKKQKNKETGKIEYVEAEKTCVEGREVMVQLPNSLLERTDLTDVAREIADWFKDHYGAECSVAIHLNKAETSVHCHIVFSERLRLPDPEITVADRNAFLDEKGIRKRTKKEILDADGQLRPGCRIVPKGEVLRTRYFGDKDDVFAEKVWLHTFKEQMATWINETLQPDELRVVFDPNGPFLAQKKIGKGRDPEVVKELEDYNKLVKIFNDKVRSGEISDEMAHRIKSQVMLSPKRMEALTVALYVETKNERRLSEAIQGGVRTAKGPDEKKKRELRALYPKAADARRRAKEAAPGSLEARMYRDEARKYSAQIDRLRMELGYAKNEEYERRLRAIREQQARILERLFKQKKRLGSLERWEDSLQDRIRYLKRELRALPLFMSAEDKAREAQLNKELAEARDDLTTASLRAALAKKELKEAREAAKKEKAALKEEKRQLKELWREQEKKQPTVGDNIGDR